MTQKTKNPAVRLLAKINSNPYQLDRREERIGWKSLKE